MHIYVTIFLIFRCISGDFSPIFHLRLKHLFTFKGIPLQYMLSKTAYYIVTRHKWLSLF
uniref:Uncharacterized protein n=1 Tax=Octopus bimaculoides TaxID=37653 RepID=A0A0L8GDS5_OCTBM